MYALCAFFLLNFCCLKFISARPLHGRRPLGAGEPLPYKAHGDVKSKSWVLGRKSFPVENAQYSNKEVSPSNEVYRVPLGEGTTIVFSLRNIGEHTFNVTSVIGYLRAFHNYKFEVDNYPEMAIIDGPLRAHSETSFEWLLTPFPDLQPVEYVLSVDVKYTTPQSHLGSLKTEEFYENVLNVTISVYDSSKRIDFELWFMLVLMVLLTLAIAAAGYVLYYVPSQIAVGNSPPTLSDILDGVAAKLQPYIGRKSQLLTVRYWTKDSAAAKRTTVHTSSKFSKPRRDDWLKGTGIQSKKRS